MGISELLLQLADPQAIKTLSFMEKMAAGLVVSFLGMGITFLSLIILQLMIGLLARFASKPATIAATDQKVKIDIAAGKGAAACENDEELIAVLSAAIAMNMQRPTEDIVIRDIRKIGTPSLVWNKAGVLDQMNSRF